MVGGDEEEVEEVVLLVLPACVRQFKEHQMQQLLALHMARSIRSGEMRVRVR